jgi:ABC-2 type transport system ATP-binding protein
MSISVNKITKLYGSQCALNEVSFEVRSGEIVGFLGPNGAGKSTMMKILTGYLPQTSGKAVVCDFDVELQGMEVKKRVGYLPEHNPLYLEMYVKEYLSFIGNLHGITNVSSRVKEMIEITGLGLEQRKKIGALSKGYRQRVGLAQALIHDPQVLIMDEPTTGLDPNQLDEIRVLIRNIGKHKTVMLSTHIMQEVEAVCDRIIIIHHGKITADGKLGELKHTVGQQVVIVEFDGKVSRNSLKKIDGVIDAIESSKQWRIIASEEQNLQKDLFEFAVNNRLTILQMTKEEQRMEDIFKMRTGKLP